MSPVEKAKEAETRHHHWLASEYAKKEAEAAPVEKVRQLAKAAEAHSQHRYWLPEDPSAAFICCIGAGPWRYARRRKVQHDALVRLNGRDITQINPAYEFSYRGPVLGLTDKESKSVRGSDWFPLDWQNNMLRCLQSALTRRQILSMRLFVSTLRRSSRESTESEDHARLSFYSFCGAPKGAKVLSLYLRDFVEIPAFPVDRHVRRTLQDLGLPPTEDGMLGLCRQAGVNPIKIARMLGTQRLDGGNPDWSKWPNKAAPEGTST